jgi:flagellar motor switch protein FliG
MKDSEIQGWLRRVGSQRADHLAMALLGAGEDVKRRVFSNLSKTAADALAEKVRKASQVNVPAQTITVFAAALEKLL